MSQKETFSVNRLFSLTGIVGAILVFAVILYVAYLPGRPPAVDYETAKKRKLAADEIRAEGLAKVTGYEVNSETGLVRIPISEAMNLTVEAYRVSENGKN